MLDAPILFLIFRRPDTTKIVFEAIKKARPSKLFIAADGPRNHIKDEEVRCQKTREVIRVDWPCEVHTLYRDKNLGLRKGVANAIEWLFEHEDRGIILEDDCLPDSSFFMYCETLLEKYKDNRNIMHIGGNNFQNGIPRGKGSYYFSRIAHVWGWATWKRAWQHYEPEMSSYPFFKRENQIQNTFDDKYSQKRWIEMLDRNYLQSSKSWAYRWTFSIFAQNGICISPNVNLVKNIGFGADGTHSFDEEHEHAQLKLQEIKNLMHPSSIEIARDADIFTNLHVFRKPTFFELLKKIYLKVKSLINL